MLSIILFIFKFIGILLASIIGLILVVSLLVLLVPIRYKIYANYKEDIVGEVNIHWLLRLIYLGVYYKEEKLYMRLYILGKIIYDSDKPRKPKIDKMEVSKKIHKEHKSKAKEKKLNKISKEGNKPKLDDNSGKGNKPKIGNSSGKSNKPKLDDKSEKDYKTDKNVIENDTSSSELAKRRLLSDKKYFQYQKIDEKFHEKKNTNDNYEIDVNLIQKDVYNQKDVNNQKDANNQKDENNQTHGIHNDVSNNKSTDNYEDENLHDKMDSNDYEDDSSFMKKIKKFLSNILAIPKKIKDFFIKIKGVAKNIKEKLHGILEIIGKIKAFIKDDINKDSFRNIIMRLKQILKHIRPKFLQIEAEFGMEDPSTTGLILGGLSVLNGLYGEHIRLYPNFEKEILIGSIVAKGRIRLGTLLMIGLRIILYKNNRQLVKNIMVLKEEL